MEDAINRKGHEVSITVIVVVDKGTAGNNEAMTATTKIENLYSDLMTNGSVENGSGGRNALI